MYCGNYSEIELNFLYDDGDEIRINKKLFKVWYLYEVEIKD